MSIQDYKFMKKLAQDDIYNINIYKLFDFPDRHAGALTGEGKRNLKRQYRTLIRLYHPDKNPPKRTKGCQDILHMLKNAYLIMTDRDLLYKYNKLYNLAKEELEHHDLKSGYFSTPGVSTTVSCRNPDNHGGKTYKECNEEIDNEIQEILETNFRYQNIKKKAAHHNPIQSLVKDELETRQRFKKPLNFVQKIQDGDKNFHRIFEHLQDVSSSDASKNALVPIDHIRSCNDRHYYKYAHTDQVDFKLMTSIDTTTSTSPHDSAHNTDRNGDFHNINPVTSHTDTSLDSEEKDTLYEKMILEKLKSFKSCSPTQTESVLQALPHGDKSRCYKSAMETYKHESHRLANLNMGDFTNDKFSVNI
jgi:curved DNA-binding protein CbpA